MWIIHLTYKYLWITCNYKKDNILEQLHLQYMTVELLLKKTNQHLRTNRVDRVFNSCKQVKRESVLAICLLLTLTFFQIQYSQGPETEKDLTADAHRNLKTTVNQKRWHPRKDIITAADQGLHVITCNDIGRKQHPCTKAWGIYQWTGYMQIAQMEQSNFLKLFFLIIGSPNSGL